MAAALLEVTEREAGLLRLCLLFGALGASGVLLGRWKRWLSFLPLAVSAFFAWVLYGEVNDPYVGATIVTQAGKQYVLLSYVAMGFGIGLPILGFVVGRRANGRRPATDDRRLKHG